MGIMDAPMAGNLFLDMPPTAALASVELQIQFTTNDVSPRRACRLGNGIITLSTKYAVVNDVPCGNLFTRAKSFGVKTTVLIDLVTRIV
jgi:hypothetical protein